MYSLYITTHYWSYQLSLVSAGVPSTPTDSLHYTLYITTNYRSYRWYPRTPTDCLQHTLPRITSTLPELSLVSPVHQLIAFNIHCQHITRAVFGVPHTPAECINYTLPHITGAITGVPVHQLNVFIIHYHALLHELPWNDR